MINELDVYHGSSETNPVTISQSEKGFDMRHSKQGLWGRAIYFSESAKYSDSYAYVNRLAVEDPRTPEKQLFIAKILLGKVKDYGVTHNKDLTMPPTLPTMPKNYMGMLNPKYDSVSGVTCNSRKYMLYDNSKSYPLYTISYTIPS